MERNAITELEQMTLNSRSKSFLKEIAKWSKFLSIMGCIGIGLMILLGVFAGAIFNSLPNAQSMPFDLSKAMSITYFVMSLIYFFPVYYLFSFSNKMLAALADKSDDLLSDALEMLKSHYKFAGVLTIIILSLYVMMFIVSLMGVALS